MNRTFKVVFNRARGGAVAVSEAASSVQRKGTKAAVVMAALMVTQLAGAACVDGTCTYENASSAAEWQYTVLAGENSQLTNPTESGVASVVISNSTFDANGQKGYFGFAGHQNIEIADSTFANSKTTALFFNGYKRASGKVDASDFGTSQVTLDNVRLINNTDQVAGSAMYIYDRIAMTMTGGEISGNSVRGTGTDQYYGGAVVVKSGDVVFENVDFDNNVIQAENGYATGGAILVDKATGITVDGKDTVGKVTFKITQNGLTYSGNNVIGAANTYVDTYGWYASTSGGFLFLDRSSQAAFDIADGVTLTIGEAGANYEANSELDSIASALPSTSALDPAYSTLDKVGSGTVQMNASMDKYFGYFNVKEGTFNIARDWNNRSTTTVSGGTLNVGGELKLDTLKHEKTNYVQNGVLSVTGGAVVADSVVLSNSAQATAEGDKASVTISGGTLTAGSLQVEDGVVAINGGTLIVDELDNGDKASNIVLSDKGTLQTSADQVFVTEGTLIYTSEADVPAESEKPTVSGLTITANGGTLAVTDSGVYTTDSLSAMSGALGANSQTSLIFLNASLAAGETAELVDNIVQATEQATAQATDGTLTVSNSGAQSLKVTGSDESADPVTALTISKKDGDTTFTLVGAGESGKLVENADGGDVAVTVSEGVTLQLGADVESTTETKGSLSEVVLSDGAALKVNNIQATVDKLTVGTETEGKTAQVSIGSSVNRGALAVDKLTINKGSTVFLDPAWSGNQALDVIANASHLEISTVEKLDGNLVAGQNSLITIGASADEAVAAFERIAAAQGVAWGKDGVTAALYVNKTLTVGTNGKVVVDGALTNAPENYDNYTSAVTIASNGMLMVDASALGEKAAVSGTLTLADGSYVGLVNATEGTFKLTDDTLTATADKVSVVTDNPFIVADQINTDGTVTAKTDAENGLTSIESLGLQAMTRRADSVLAATIADRTSFGQQLKPGLNLWVDVAGENYQADDFDKGGEFEADMGYGTFGADVAVGNFTVGGALQYGTGTLRSSVSGIKNSIDNYGVSLYGTYSVTDNFKLGAELAYVWGENDITADQTALNQSVDTEMYSAGVRAMYEMKAGNFRFVPSIGLRVSQLSTDEMKVGAVKIEDQDQTLVQLPIAMRITAADYSTASGWTLSPSFKLAYVPTFGDKDIEVLNTAEDVIDTSPVQANFGLMAGKDNMLFNVNFMLGAGEYGSSAVGGKVGFKYAF